MRTDRASQKRKLILVLSIILSLILPASALAAVEDIAGYAWSETSGWFNASPTIGITPVGGVQVVDELYLTGFVWAENIGWIKLGRGAAPYPAPASQTATNYGVNLQGSGDIRDLVGYGWSETAGWIRFDPDCSAFGDPPGCGGKFAVSGASSGNFSGFVWSENAGWIHLSNTLLADPYAWATLSVVTVADDAVSEGETNCPANYPAYYTNPTGAFPNAGGPCAEFSVTINKENTDTIQVSYSTVAVTAEAGTDYIVSNGTIDIPISTPSGPSGEKIIYVPVIDDQITDEPDETFTIDITVLKATSLSPEATATIADNDHALTVVLDGDGTGSVTTPGTPPANDGIDCDNDPANDPTGTDCGGIYIKDEIVDLTAVPDPGDGGADPLNPPYPSAVAEWAGGGCDGTSGTVCTVTMTQSHTVTVFLRKDSDGDGVPDDGDGVGGTTNNPCFAGNTVGCDDNCTTDPNPGQEDGDGDGTGNACDSDRALTSRTLISLTPTLTEEGMYARSICPIPVRQPVTTLPAAQWHVLHRLLHLRTLQCPLFMDRTPAMTNRSTVLPSLTTVTER
jgi:hypothetical protein